MYGLILIALDTPENWEAAARELHRLQTGPETVVLLVRPIRTEDERQEAEQHLQAVVKDLESFGYGRVRGVVQRGESKSVIMQTAREHAVDLVIMPGSQPCAVLSTPQKAAPIWNSSANRWLEDVRRWREEERRALELLSTGGERSAEERRQLEQHLRSMEGLERNLEEMADAHDRMQRSHAELLARLQSLLWPEGPP